MTALATLPSPRGLRTTTTVLDVVVPVYNEQHSLAPCVRRLHEYRTSSVPFSSG